MINSLSRRPFILDEPPEELRWRSITGAYSFVIMRTETPALDPLSTLPDDPPAIEEPVEVLHPDETIEDIKKRAPAPPAGGVCQACKMAKPINRLKLCYECWLMDKLHKESGGNWLPGDPHPKSCGCDGPGGCSTKDQNN